MGSLEFVALQDLHDLDFDVLGHLVGLGEVGANGFGHEDVEVLWLVVWEEQHLGWEDPHQHDGQEQQSHRAPEECPGTAAPKHIGQEALIRRFKTRQKRVLELQRGRVQHVGVEQRQDARQRQNVAKARGPQGEKRRAHCDQNPGHHVRAVAVHVLFSHLHEDRRQDGVDDQCHKQRRPQNDDQGHGQVAHELPDESRPKGQRQKRRKRGAGRGDDGPRHLAHAIAGGFQRTVPLVHQTVHVLHHHNAVVDKHAERQHQ